MKRTINLLAEVVSLPFSGYFIGKDPFVEKMEQAGIHKQGVSSIQKIHNLEKYFDDVAFHVADELNRHVEINNLSELQNLIKRTFDPMSIFRGVVNKEDPEERAVLYLFYFDLLRKITSSMLTNRDGIAMLRPWHGSYETHFPFEMEDFETASVQQHAFFPQRIEIWNSLLRCMPEDVFISCYAAILINTSLSEEVQRYGSLSILKSFGDSVHIADELLDKLLDQGMAETHVHAGAAKSFGIVWEDMLSEALCNLNVKATPVIQLPYKQKMDQKDLQSIVLECAVVRLLLASFLFSKADSLDEYLNTQPLSEPYQRHFQFSIPEIYKDGHPSCLLSTSYVSGRPFFNQGSLANETSIWNLLELDTVQKNSVPTLAEHCFLCWSLLRIQNKPDDIYFIALFMYYLRMRSLVYRYHVQDSKNKGLDYFQKYYRVSTDKGSISTNSNWQRIFYNSLKDKRIQKTEIRFAPRNINALTKESGITQAEINIFTDVVMFIRHHLFAVVHKFAPNDIFTLEKSFDECWQNAIQDISEGRDGALLRLLEHFEVDIDRIHNHAFGIVYHFIKSGEKTEEVACFAEAKATPDIERYKHFSFGKARFQYECCIHALSNIRDICPELSRLLVGIDAASLEIPTEPWVFSPAFHLARQRNSTLCYENNIATNKALLGITYHVGEDFNHPLSGLRHIDEAIDLLGMHAGDRLGHALVLGIDIPRWFRKNKLVALPRIEWIENNIWLWHLFTSETDLSDIACYSKIIEKQILTSAKQIYGTTNGITIDNLFQAYSRKSSSVEETISQTKEYAIECAAIDCFEVDNELYLPCRTAQDKTTKSWTTEALELSYHCNYYKHRMNEIIIVPDNEGYIQITQRLQEYLRQKAAKKGLFIEANPSSNAVIGEMDGVLMHPAWQFRRVIGNQVMTSINTDDPLLFNANVANEHAYVYYALRYHGMSVEEALKEIDIMRRMGIYSSFIRETPKFSQLLNGYERILYSLDCKFGIHKFPR